MYQACGRGNCGLAYKKNNYGSGEKRARKPRLRGDTRFMKNACWLSIEAFPNYFLTLKSETPSEGNTQRATFWMAF